MTIIDEKNPETTSLSERDGDDLSGAPRSASVSGRRRILRIAILAFFFVYVILALMPFYFLFVRTFVATADSTDMWWWLPPEEEVNMNAEIGNLSIFLNLDIAEIKAEWGIPLTEYVEPRWDLNRISEEYDIPLETIRATLTPFGRFNGWIVLLGGGSGFWSAIGRTAIVTVIGVIGINVLGIMTGSALAGLRFRYQRWIYAIFLVSVVIPPFLLLLPQFLMVNQIQSLIPGSQETGLVREVSQLAVLVFLYIQGGALSTMIFTSAIGAIPREHTY